MMPVTLHVTPLSTNSVLPSASVELKYFFAVVSSITIEFGSFKAVIGLPAIIGTGNTWKKVESANTAL